MVKWQTVDNNSCGCKFCHEVQEETRTESHFWKLFQKENYFPRSLKNWFMCLHKLKMVARGWHETEYLRIKTYVLPLYPKESASHKAMMRRCGYLNESYPKEELKLRTKVGGSQYLLQGRRGMSHRFLASVIMS